MAHPVVVVTVGEVLTGVSTARLLACLSRHNQLVGASQQVPQFESLNEVAAENKTSVQRIPSVGGEIKGAHEFQIMERSLIPTSFQVLSTRLSSLTPFSSEDCVRKTAASAYIQKKARSAL